MTALNTLGGRWWIGWALATLAGTAGWVASRGLAEATGGLSFVIFVLVVLLVSLTGDWKPAAAVAGLALAAAWDWLLAQPAVGRIGWTATILPLGLFGAVVAAQILLVHRLIRALARLEWKRAELERLRSSERLMFRELQHRVANGIQMVASLLSLEASRIKDTGDAGAALEDAVARLGMVATVHRRLHDPALGEAGLGKALQTLARDILDAGGKEGVALRVIAPPLAITPADATSVAMIVAEAVTNAMKHAFDGREDGLVEIVLAEEANGERRLTIRDDGPGFRDGTEAEGNHLGLLVMRSMAQRIGGRLELGDDPRGGALVTVVMERRAD